MIYCCKEHVDLALDVVVYEYETAPVMNEIPEEKKLSTGCEYCSEPAVYMVGN
ncbi:CxxH/CxxC protein [Bacillus sp. 1P06AnD]|uniref:CxxH/CxxC protein n=1 Tax=Bacillus sp. 1P06AnD TaxID=3132208 RepID=UPI0039A23ED6